MRQEVQGTVQDNIPFKVKHFHNALKAPCISGNEPYVCVKETHVHVCVEETDVNVCV